MLFDRHGKRYLTEDEFTSYCGDLNLPLQNSAEVGFHVLSDLERFEKADVLLPAAEIRFPGDYTREIRIRRRQLGGPNPLDDPKWADLRPLLVPAIVEPSSMTDDDLWHHFDREFDRANRFLLKPTRSTTKARKPKQVPLLTKRARRNVANYYHYWQAYQVYAIQKHYSWFALTPDLLLRLTQSATNEEDREWFARYWPQPTEAFLQLAPNDSLFEPLSIYIWLRTQEARRSFARSLPGAGYQSLSGTAFTDYDQRVADHARAVQQEYNLTEPQLVQFACDLIHFRSGILKDERQRLASQVEQDLWFLREFLIGITGKTPEALADEVGKYELWVKNQFLNLDKVVEASNKAVEDLQRSRARYNTTFQGQVVSEQEVRNMVDFLNDNDLFIVAHTISEGRRYLGEQRDFYDLSRYILMKNLSTGLEDFLRKIYDISQGSITKSTAQLKALVGAVFPWQSAFDSKCDTTADAARKQLSDPSDQAIWCIYDVSTDPALDSTPHLRIFLTAYWARNLTSHRHPFTNDFSHDLLYGHLGGRVFGAIIECFFYTWTYAKQKRWIT